MKKRLIIITISILCFVSSVQAFEPFIIEDIKVNGLQRISLGAVLNGLNLKVGDKFDENQTSDVIRALFKSGFYEDIELEKDGNVLVVNIKERPAIASISISGNKEIDSETLKEELKKLGLSENQIFNRSLLDNVELGLQQQYFSLGKYGVKIISKVDIKERNKVDVSIQIHEGQAASIKKINLVGNKVFDEEDLVGIFELAEEEDTYLFSDADQYSQPKLRADLETLRSYYLDRGYINFKILSTQVTISPDKKFIFITINIAEGEKYFIDEVNLAGDMVLPKQELMQSISIKPGDVFSRKNVSFISNALREKFGDQGYAFTNINAIPDINDEEQKVSLTFFADPGKRVYVRRINISGNDKTNDDVIRREFRQMEGAWFEPKKLERTKVRLQRLGFFEDINISTPQVPGTTDQVDVNLKVAEGSTGSVQGGIGYGEPRGVLFNAKVSLNNFVGTGKQVSLEASNDDVNTIYSFTYSNPYHTESGISRSISAFFRKTDAGESNVADFSLDDKGIRVNYGFPISEFSTARLGLGVQNSVVKVEDTAALFYQSWVNGETDPDTGDVLVEGHGNNFDTFTINAAWSHDTRNRTFLADDGHLTRLSTEFSVPGGDLEYYKFNILQDSNFDVGKGFTLRLKGQIGYGDSFGETRQLPFFERFYAGGSRSIRGFEGNSLGPRDEDIFPRNDPEADDPLATDDVIGGTLKVVGNIELIFPLPFTENSRAFRLGTFVDIGNVFLDRESYDSGDLRRSYGFFALWVTPVGVLTFNWGFPINKVDGDETERFQFTIGAPF